MLVINKKLLNYSDLYVNITSIRCKGEKEYMFEFYKFDFLVRKNGCKKIVSEIIGNRKMIIFEEDSIVFSNGSSRIKATLKQDNIVFDYIKNEKEVILKFPNRKRQNPIIELECVEKKINEENSNKEKYYYTIKKYEKIKGKRNVQLISTKTVDYEFAEYPISNNQNIQNLSSPTKVKIKK